LIYVLTQLNFGSLIQVDQAFYCLTLFLKYGALVKLRMSQPNLPRPYRIPLELKGLILFVIPPLLFSVAVVILTVISSWLTFGIILGLSCFTLILPFIIHFILRIPVFDDHRSDHPEIKEYNFWDFIKSKLSNYLTNIQQKPEEIEQSNLANNCDGPEGEPEIIDI